MGKIYGTVDNTMTDVVWKIMALSKKICFPGLIWLPCINATSSCQSSNFANSIRKSFHVTISFFCNVWTLFTTTKKLLRKRINLLNVEKYFCWNVEFYFVEFEFESARGHGGSSVVSCVNSELLFLESRQTRPTVKMDKEENYEQYRARGRVWWLYLSAQKSETKKSFQVTVCSVAAAILGSML